MAGRGGREKIMEPDKPILSRPNAKRELLNTSISPSTPASKKSTQTNVSTSLTNIQKSSTASSSGLPKVKSSNNLSLIGKSDGGMSELAAAQILRAARLKLSQTTEINQSASSSTTINQSASSSTPTDQSASFTQDQQLLTIDINSNGSTPNATILPPPEKLASSEHVHSVTNEEENEDTPGPVYCTITSHATDITKISKVKVVREIANYVTEFRVNYERSTKSIEIKLIGQCDVERLKEITTLNTIPVIITQKTLPLNTPSLNTPSSSSQSTRTTSWGKIYSDDLFDCEDEELLEQLQGENENILLAKRIFRGGIEKKPTRLIRIKFNTIHTPDKIFCCSDAYTVTSYTPPPTKCSKCKKFGHLARDCRSSWICNRCAMTHDRHHNCEQTHPTPSCIYCGPGHSSNDSQCPRYLKEKEIVEISHERNLSFLDARQQINSGQRSYASTVRMSKPTHNPTPVSQPTITNNPPSNNPQHGTPQTNEIGTLCQFILPETRDSLSKGIKGEIERAIQNPSIDTKIITAKIPRTSITCPAPLTSILGSISRTLDIVHHSNKPGLVDEFMNLIHEISNKLESLEARIEDNDNDNDHDHDHDHD